MWQICRPQRQIPVETREPTWFVTCVSSCKYLCDLCIGVVVALQNFECKMFNILDKPLYIRAKFSPSTSQLCCRGAVLGYITVLPGVFSAYRYIVLQNDARGEGLLQKYFLGETLVRSINPSPVEPRIYVCSTKLARTSSL